MSLRWTEESIKKEALKYSSRAKFQKLSNNAYQAAYRYKILDSICSHMPKDKKIGSFSNNRKWTKESIEKEALKYNDRTQFWAKNPSACIAANKLSILDLVCKHMKCSLSKPEQLLKEAIQLFYPDARKMRDGTFELDIYIKDLNKGIEFDGTYWHSIEGLKRSRPHWSDEELRNYHTIKDEHFSKNGIKVFHVKETDWNKDPNTMIYKVMEFLGE